MVFDRSRDSYPRCSQLDLRRVNGVKDCFQLIKSAKSQNSNRPPLVTNILLSPFSNFEGPKAMLPVLNKHFEEITFSSGNPASNRYFSCDSKIRKRANGYDQIIVNGSLTCLFPLFKTFLFSRCEKCRNK